MKTEFEVKFPDVDFGVLRERLKSLGAVQKQKMRTMRRAIIDNSNMKQRNAFLRIRDEGDKITLTYKQFNDLSVDGAKEYEIVVNDFQVTVDLLEAAGLPYRSLQESRRETWELDGAEIALDEWPWLKPYIEIEGNNEDHVRKVANQLGFSWKNALFGDVMAVYRAQYPHLSAQDTVGNIPEVRFNDPLPELLTGSE